MDSLNQEILNRIGEMNEEALCPDGLEDAVIGYVERFGFTGPLVLLDKDKCIEILMKDMSYEDAVEHFEYNVIGAWCGDGTPCFATIVYNRNNLI